MTSNEVVDRITEALRTRQSEKNVLAIGEGDKSFDRNMYHNSYLGVCQEDRIWCDSIEFTISVY